MLEVPDIEQGERKNESDQENSRKIRHANLSENRDKAYDWSGFVIRPPGLYLDHVNHSSPAWGVEKLNCME